MQHGTGKSGGVTIRAVLIGLAFVPVNVYLVVQWETVWGTQYPTTMGIFFNAIFCLFLVTVLNLPLKKLVPTRALSQGELLTVYIVLLSAIAVSGHDFTQGLFCSIGTVSWSATPENEWTAIFGKYPGGAYFSPDEPLNHVFTFSQLQFYLDIHPCR